MKDAALALSIVIGVAATQVADAQGTAAYYPGTQMLEIADPAGQRPLEGLLWYPTREAGPLRKLHEPRVMLAPDHIANAAPVEGPLPLVVVSHGMFGNIYNQGWLGEALSRRGYALAVVNHPGTSTWSRAPDVRRKLWERPRDVSRVIDHLLSSASPVSIDPERIYMAGHSLGGFTAALLAGARYDAAQLQQACERLEDDLVCGIFQGWGIAQTPEDRAAMQADLSDDRIKAFALFDLGGTQSFAPASLAAIDTPMLVFGAPVASTGIDLDVESRALMAMLPEATARYIETPLMSHFDFLGVCTEDGLETLKRLEPEDAVVCERGTSERVAMHQMVVQELLGFIAGQ